MGAAEAAPERVGLARATVRAEEGEEEEARALVVAVAVAERPRGAAARVAEAEAEAEEEEVEGPPGARTERGTSCTARRPPLPRRPAA
jgi:hypothetical protein